MAEGSVLSAEGQGTIVEQLQALVGQTVDLSVGKLLGIMVTGELTEHAAGGFAIHVVDVDTMQSAHAYFGAADVAEVTPGAPTKIRLNLIAP